jgi:hypothetical protein
MTVTYQFAYTALGPWTAVWNSAINPTEPTFYAVQANVDGSVELFVSGPAVAGATGAGALAKGVVSSPAIPFSQLTTNVLVTVDDSPARQWIEIDTRLTTADGFTYPGDMDIGLDGTVRVGDISGVWHVSPVKLAPFQPWTATPLSILKTYDFTKKTVTMFGMTFPAANIGWAPNEIVNQIQIDQAPAGGTCMACFSNISMAGS